MHSATTPGKSSTDSSNTQVGLDRWSQRRLQRLNTEHIFREQRQGQQQQQQAQPHPSQQQQQASTAYHAAQSNSQNNLHSPYVASSPPSSSSAASPGVYIPTHQQQYSPPEQNNHSYRQLQQSRSFTQPLDDTAASTPTDLQSKPRSANRQSVHNTNMSAPSANNPVSSPMPPTTTTQTKDVGRSTPQLSGSDDMSQEDVDQLIKDHKELRQ